MVVGVQPIFVYFLYSSYISYYYWFLSGNFSFTLILALPPHAAFFCWLKSSTVICGFPEREPLWSGGGGRLRSNTGVVGVPGRVLMLERAGVWGESWLLIQASPGALFFQQKSALSN